MGDVTANPPVHAGQVYRGKADRGFRYVRIHQVRSPEACPYALAREILPSGALAYGVDGMGVPRDQEITIALVFDAADRPVMPARYELTEEVV